jgi:arylsulfatase A-like enzyme
MRTDDWRFVEWRRSGEPNVYELYDHRADPQENLNLANRPERAGLLKEPSRRLHKELRPWRPASSIGLLDKA